jgi:RHS repeat-associated protein
LSIAACFVLSVMSVEMAPSVAAATPPTKTPDTSTTAKSKPAKPVPAAKPKPYQAPTEIPSLRTAYSDTYDNHDSTYSAIVSSEPINYRPSANAAWAPIDLTFSAISGGNGRLRASKTAAPVEVGAPDDAAGFASVDTGSGKISLSLAPGAKPDRAGSKPVAADGRADVSGLLSGVDLRVVPGVDGFRLFLTLASRPAQSSFSFTLNSPGLTPSLQADGTISFANAKGAVVATMPAPYAMDSTTAEGLGNFTDQVSYSLSKPAGKNLLTVSVDQSWLASATYPVYVDPSVTVAGTPAATDTFVNSAYKTTPFYNWVYAPDGYHELALGTDPTTAGVCYGLMTFALPSDVLGSTVSAATLAVYPYHQYVDPPAASNTWVDRVTSTWSKTVTWNSQPSHTNITAQKLVQGKASSFSVGSTVQSWASGTTTNYGFQLNESTYGVTYWKRLISSEETGAAQKANAPQLTITYSKPSVTIPSPLSGAWTGTKILPTWSYIGNGGPAQASWKADLSTSPTFANYVYQQPATSGGATGWTIPANVALVSGTTYYWRVYVSDGTAWSPTPAVDSFKWDGTSPVWNGFTAPTALVDQSATSFAFGWNAATDPESGVAGYEVVAQSALVSSAGVCSTSWATMSDTMTSATSSTLANLVNNSCYRVGVRAIGAVAGIGGGSSVYAYSNPVLIDTTTSAGLGAPIVTDNCAGIGSCYRAGNTIYFNPSAAKKIVLSSTGTDLISGTTSSTFSFTIPSTGWTSGIGTITGNPASAWLTWSASSVATNVSVATVDGAGVVSPATTLIFVPQAGPEADFATPVAGTINYAKPGSYSVAWTETAGTSSITSRSLQRQTEVVGSDGTCNANNWTNDTTAPPVTTGSPVSSTGLVADTCYQWVQTLTDTAGTHTFTSAPVLVDGTAPTVSFLSPAANAPVSATVTITGTAFDAHFGSTGSWSLSYGAGTAPTTWAPIGNAQDISATAGTLATWATGSLNGIYTLKLTATDAAGNAPQPTQEVIYIDNTDRDSASVPFDLGGGWSLGVNVATGEASLARDLFSIPSYGPDQALSLSYQSAQTSAAGLFGTGWSSNLSQYLDVSNSSSFITWHEADGDQVPFGLVGGTWTALAGNYETLAPAGTGYIITETDNSSSSFDSTGKLAAVTDRYGSSLTLNWASSPVTASDASGRSTSIVVSAGQISSVTDSAGRKWSFGYTGSALSTITDPATPPDVTTLVYDGSGRLAGVSRALTPIGGSAATVKWTWAYDSSSRVTSVTDPTGASVSPVNSSTFNYGVGTTTTHVLSVVATSTAPSAVNSSVYTYDAHGWLTGEIDAAGWTTTNTYYPDGNLKVESRQIDTAGHTAKTSYTYDTAGNVKTETDPDGIVTTNTYSPDGYNNLLSKVVLGWKGSPPPSSTTNYVYDASHRLCLSIEDPTVDPKSLTCTFAVLGGNADQNVENAFSYNANNQLELQTDPLDHQTRHLYYPDGDEQSVTKNYVNGGVHDDSTNVTISYTYDTAGHVLTETDPVEVSPAVNEVKTYTYNVFGAGLTEIDPGDASIRALEIVNTYDEFDNKTSTTQNTCATSDPTCPNWAVINKTTIQYNALSQATVVTATTPATTDAPASSSATSTSYDIAGDALSTTTPDGVTATDTYDGLDRLTSETTDAATLHAYDGLGDETCTVAPASGTTNVATGLACTSISSPAGTASTLTTSRSFDPDGNLLSQTIDVTGTPATTSYTLDGLGRTVSSTDPTGLVTTTTYDALGQVAVSVTGTSATDTTYDRVGGVLRSSQPYDGTKTNPAKTYTARAYDALGRDCRIVADATVDLYGLTDPCHSPITTTATSNIDAQTYFDAAGDAIASVTSGNPNAVIDRSIYNVRGLVNQTISNCVDAVPASPATCAGNVAGDASINIKTADTYSATGTVLSSSTTTAGIEDDTVYDGSGHVVASIKDKSGLDLETDYHYDSAGRQVAQKTPAGTAANPTYVVSITHYDTDDRVDYTIDDCFNTPAPANWYGCTTGGANDGTANQTTTFSYDDAGNKSYETSPTGLVTQDTYDDNGNVLTETENWVAHYAGSDPTINAATATGYDDADRQISSTDPAGATTLSVYDANGNVCRAIANATAAVVSTQTANPPTLTCTSSLAAGAQTANANIDTQFSYDNVGHKVSMSAPSPSEGPTPATRVATLYAYDVADRLCRVLENATLAPTDIAKLANPCTDPLPVGTAITTTQNVDSQYAYDDNGNMTGQIVPADPTLGTGATATTSYLYDAQNRLTSETDPDGNTAGASDATKAAHSITFTYDTIGNKTSETVPGPDGGTTYYFYDTLNGLCQRAALSPTAANSYTAPTDSCKGKVAGASIDTQFGFDRAGNQTSATDALTGESISSNYDLATRPLNVSDSGGAGPTSSTAYTYGSNKDSNTSWGVVTRTDPSGSYSFNTDAYGREVTLADTTAIKHASLPNPFSWTYNAAGDVSGTTDPTGNSTTYTHDYLGRPATVSTSRTTACGTGCSAYAFTYTNNYNAAGSKISATSTIAGDPALGTTNYAYDPLSRLTTYTPPSASTAMAQTYGWNSMPDRTSITNGPTGSQATTAYDAASRPSGAYTSDDQGRITTMPGTHAGESLTLSWDILGRLAKVVSSKSGTTSYTYDPLDRLETIVAPNATTVFAYVGLTDAVATSTTGSQEIVHATDLDGTELYEYAASTTPTPVYLQRNTHGDVTWTTNEAGAPTGNAAYDPFGTLAASSGSIPSTRWQSSYQDDSTGLYYVVARWYSPTFGGFLSDDPLAGNAILPQGRDPYAYGSGDPVGNGDPSGQCSADDWTSAQDCLNSPTPTPSGPPTSAILNTSVAGQIYEPKNFWTSCGAGALRILLAFAGTDKTWNAHLPKTYSGWGYKETHPYVLNANGHKIRLKSGKYETDPSVFIGGWGTYTLQASDPHGQNYLEYLATQVVGWGGGPGVEEWDGAGIGVNGPPRSLFMVANFESGQNSRSGLFQWSQYRHYKMLKCKAKDAKCKATNAYHTQQMAAESAIFDSAVVRQISTYGVPVPVAAPMRALPSQKRAPGGAHWISIVGYDPTYYYYIDTCPHALTGCGYSPIARDIYTGVKEDTDPAYDLSMGFRPRGYEWRNDSGHPQYKYTWRIPKSSLWSVLTDYIRDNGTYAASSTGR